MLKSRTTRRGLVVLSVAAHLAAGLLATVAHDHGGCCGHAPQAAAVTAAPDLSGLGSETPRTCRHGHCRHAISERLEQPPADGAAAARDSGPATPSEPALTARCLACDFLAGAVATLPWTPVIGSSPARWRAVCRFRPAERLPPAMVFLARGPPVDALPASATACIELHTPTHTGTPSHVHAFFPPRPPPGVHPCRAARHDRDHRHPARALVA